MKLWNATKFFNQSWLSTNIRSLPAASCWKCTRYSANLLSWNVWRNLLYDWLSSTVSDYGFPRTNKVWIKLNINKKTYFDISAKFFWLWNQARIKWDMRRALRWIALIWVLLICNFVFRKQYLNIQTARHFIKKFRGIVLILCLSKILFMRS